MRRKSSKNSTVEPKETLETVLGVQGEAKQVELVKTVLNELVHRRQLHQVFVSVVFRPSDGRMSLQYSDDATYDDVLAVLEKAQHKIVEKRYMAGVEEESKKNAAPPPDHTHEH